MEAGKLEAAANSFAGQLEPKWLRMMADDDDDDDDDDDEVDGVDDANDDDDDDGDDDGDDDESLISVPAMMIGYDTGDDDDRVRYRR